MLPLDTSAEAHEAQLGAYRRMGAEARVRIAFRLSEEVREVGAQGIRARHPEYSEAQVRGALFRLMYGDELALAAWPGEALVSP